MTAQKLRRLLSPKLKDSNNILEILPHEAKSWLESLPWHQRRYVLSLCHLICASAPETQAIFLDDYTADGLVSKMVEDRINQERVQELLQEFEVDIKVDEELLRSYIRQFYIHSAQDNYRQPVLYLESALKLVLNTEERNNVFNYFLGFELLKLLFRMSWQQHERLYRLQRNQEEFIHAYIKPIQHAHRLNRIIVPVHEKQFFARRNYFVQQPEISDKKLVQLVMATFSAEIVTGFGFGIIRHPKFLIFDYDYIYKSDSEAIFS